MEGRIIEGSRIYDMPEAAQLIQPGYSWMYFTNWNDIERPGGAKVAKVLRAMANGKSFNQALDSA